MPEEEELTVPASIAEAKKCAVALLNDADEGDLDFYIYAGGIGVTPGSIYDAHLIMGLYALIKHIFDLTSMDVQVAVFDITHCEFKDCKGAMRKSTQNTQLATAEEFARFSRAELGLGVKGAPAFYFAVGDRARFYNPTAITGPGNGRLADLPNAQKMVPRAEKAKLVNYPESFSARGATKIREKFITEIMGPLEAAGMGPLEAAGAFGENLDHDDARQIELEGRLLEALREQARLDGAESGRMCTVSRRASSSAIFGYEPNHDGW